MAVLVSNTGFDFRNMSIANLFYGSSYDANPTYLRIWYTSSYYVQFSGSGFTYGSDGAPTSGTVNRYEESFYGLKVVVKDFSISAVTLAKYAYTGDTNGAIADVLSEPDKIYGSLASDWFAGYGGSDILVGRGGDDTIRGGFGNDKVYGNYGFDVLYGEGGDDRIYGGFGQDSIYGGDQNDLLRGEVDNDFLNGGNGNDTVGGDGGNDTIYGGSGDDRLFGNDGNDSLFGESGVDRIYAGPGGDTAKGGDQNDVIYGGRGFDTLYGGNGNDFIRGEADNDTIYGGAGRDRIGGDYGADKIYGEGGNDRLFGAVGNDVLVGGDGNDVLYGGAGLDYFRFDASLNGSINVDLIKDFGFLGQDDIIQLDDDIFSSLSAGLAGQALDSDYFIQGSAASDSNDYIIYDNSTGALYYDQDGSGGGYSQIQFAEINNVPLSSADFFVIF